MKHCGVVWRSRTVSVVTCTTGSSLISVVTCTTGSSLISVATCTTGSSFISVVTCTTGSSLISVVDSSLFVVEEHHRPWPSWSEVFHRDRFLSQFCFFFTPQICFDWFMHTAWHSPLCRWHSNLRLLSAWWLFPATEPCFWLHKRRGQVDVIQPTSTPRWQDWGDLVHFAMSPASDSFCSVRRWHWCRCACHFSSRSGYLNRLGSIDADGCSRTVSACFASLRQIGSIRQSVTRPVLQSLVAALTLSRLDYGCSTMAGLPARQSNRLQSVLNAAARLVYSARRTELLSSMNSTGFRSLSGLSSVLPYSPTAALTVQRRLAQRVANISSRTLLRSASMALLHVPWSKYRTIGDRAFPVAAAKVWNSLPPLITSLPSLPWFRKALKTELFRRSYGDDHTATLTAGH